MESLKAKLTRAQQFSVITKQNGQNKSGDFVNICGI